MDKKRFAITATTEEKYAEGKKLSHTWQLDFIVKPLSEEGKHYDYLIVLTQEFLGLYKTTEEKFNPFFIDFNSAKLRYRSDQAGLRNELLARAIGQKPKDHPTIVDATAGLGRDSFILASLGFKVTMLERSPILFLLLEDALKRAHAHPKTAEITKNLNLVFTDTTIWLQNLSPANFPDVIYLDPMFPERKKSASVKKEMVILQDLLGTCQDSALLFESALACAKKRVVVKRPRSAPHISAEREPNFSFLGKSSRFDVYLTFNETKF